MNCYDVLDVNAEARPKEIKAAYRKLKKELQPQINVGSLQDIQKFGEVYLAYDVLKNPIERADHDFWIRLEDRARRNEEREAAGQNEHPDKGQFGDIMCERCGKKNSSLRYTILLRHFAVGYTIIHKPAAKLLCSKCRIILSNKMGFVTMLLGWMELPSGPFITAAAVMSNIKGGRQPKPHNNCLLSILAHEYRLENNLSEAYKCIKAKTERTQKDEEFLREVEEDSEENPGISFFSRYHRLSNSLLNFPLWLIVIILTLTIAAIARDSADDYQSKRLTELHDLAGDSTLTLAFHDNDYPVVDTATVAYLGKWGTNGLWYKLVSSREFISVLPEERANVRQLLNQAYFVDSNMDASLDFTYSVKSKRTTPIQNLKINKNYILLTERFENRFIDGDTSSYFWQE
ncbi:MAG: DnaJ domain-containing protein [candidate division Zixibacteria bacterium]|nr:DnaJ domain-containing protein [candidate division Zixibacteria bacterium]